MMIKTYWLLLAVDLTMKVKTYESSKHHNKRRYITINIPNFKITSTLLLLVLIQHYCPVLSRMEFFGFKLRFRVRVYYITRGVHRARVF